MPVSPWKPQRTLCRPPPGRQPTPAEESVQRAEQTDRFEHAEKLVETSADVVEHDEPGVAIPHKRRLGRGGVASRSLFGRFGLGDVEGMAPHGAQIACQGGDLTRIAARWGASRLRRPAPPGRPATRPHVALWLNRRRATPLRWPVRRRTD